MDTPSVQPHDPGLEPRVSRLEENMHDVKTTLARIEARLEATATAAQVAQMETKVATRDKG
jgi:hypothetical protein